MCTAAFVTACATCASRLTAPATKPAHLTEATDGAPSPSWVLLQQHLQLMRPTHPLDGADHL